MATLKFEYPLLIREYHLDTFGHVNNARYLDILEEARWEAVSQRGYGVHDVQKARKGPVILEVKLEFKKELKLRQKIIITTQTLNYSGKIGELEQFITDSEGTIYARALFKVGFFDLELRRLIEPTPEWFHAIGWTP